MQKKQPKVSVYLFLVPNLAKVEIRIMKKILFFYFVCSIFSNCVQDKVNEDSVNTKSSSEENTQASKKELTAISELKDGVSAQQAQKFRLAYRSKNFITADDGGAYAFLNLSECTNTAIVYRDGASIRIRKNINKKYC